MFEPPAPAAVRTAENRNQPFPENAGPGRPEPATGAATRITRPPGPVLAPRPLEFRLAHGELILKRYNVVTLRPGLFKRQRGHGTLYVTDARVIFYAQVYPRGTQQASWLFQQTKLEDISGLSAIVSRRVSLGMAVLTLCCALAALVTLLTLLLPLTFLFGVLTVILVVTLIRDASRGGDVGVSINSREIGISPINFGHLPEEPGFFDKLGRLLVLPVALFLRSYSAFDVMNGDPGEDAAELLHELGALIIDLQTRGTMAYPAWNIAVPAGAVGAAGGQ